MDGKWWNAAPGELRGDEPWPSVEDDKYDCPTCGGEGSYEVEGVGDNMDVDVVTCETCNGSGRINADELMDRR